MKTVWHWKAIAGLLVVSVILIWGLNALSVWDGVPIPFIMISNALLGAVVTAVYMCKWPLFHFEP